jgi:gluconate 2-dehydrogenase gamma chain
MKYPSRRDFIGKTLPLSGVITFAPQLYFSNFETAVAEEMEDPVRRSASRYSMLGPEEAAFTEAMVKVMCPADRLTPDGVTCGLATAIDQLLASDFGAEPSPNPRLTRKQFYKRGVAAMGRACQQRFGARPEQVSPADFGVLLHDVRAGRITDAEFPLEAWSHPFVGRLVEKACFSAPVYNGYNNKVFWKLFSGAAT